MKVGIKKLSEEAITPKYATSGSSGFDFHSIESVTIQPGETKLIKTGLSFDIPKGFEMQVRPRSGMSLKTPFRINNSPGTVDSDYLGEVCIIGSNVSTDVPVVINKGDRIAQGVVCPVVQVTFELVEELKVTERGVGAFGHSGV